MIKKYNRITESKRKLISKLEGLSMKVIPPSLLYKDLIKYVSEKKGIDEYDARDKYGYFTVKDWLEKLKDTMEEKMINKRFNKNLREMLDSKRVKRLKENALQDDEVLVKLTVAQLREVLETVDIDPEDIEVTDLDGAPIYDVYSLVWESDE